MNFIEAITAITTDKSSVFEAFINNEQCLLLWDNLYEGIATVYPDRTANGRCLNTKAYHIDEIMTDWDVVAIQNPYEYKAIYDVDTGQLIVTNGEEEIELVSALGQSLEFREVDEKHILKLKLLEIEVDVEKRITLKSYTKFITK